MSTQPITASTATLSTPPPAPTQQNDDQSCCLIRILHYIIDFFKTYFGCCCCPRESTGLTQPLEVSHSEELWLPPTTLRETVEIAAALTVTQMPGSQDVAEAQNIQSRIQWVNRDLRAANRPLPVGCLLSSFGEDPSSSVPVMYIVVPFVEGIEANLPRLPTNGDPDQAWRIYIQDGQKFFARQHAYYSRRPGTTLQPPLTRYEAPTTTPATTPTTSQGSPSSTSVTTTATRPSAPATSQVQPVQGALNEDAEFVTMLSGQTGIPDSHVIPTARAIRARINQADNDLRQAGHPLPVSCLLSSDGRNPLSPDPVIYIVVPFVEGLEASLPRMRPTEDPASAWIVYIKDGQKFFAWHFSHLQRKATHPALPPPLIRYTAPTTTPATTPAPATPAEQRKAAIRTELDGLLPSYLQNRLQYLDSLTECIATLETIVNTPIALDILIGENHRGSIVVFLQIRADGKTPSDLSERELFLRYNIRTMATAAGLHHLCRNSPPEHRLDPNAVFLLIIEGHHQRPSGS